MKEYDVKNTPIVDLVNKIKLLDNADTVKKLGLNAKKRLINDFSVENHYSILIDVFTSLLKK